MDTDEHGSDGHGLEGVRITRRAALRGALSIPAWLAIHACTTGSVAGTVRAAPAAERPTDAGRDAEIGAFLDEWQQRTTVAVEAGATDDDAHLHALLADLARLDLLAFPPRERDAFSNGEFTSGPIRGTPTFLVLEFEMAPGAPIQAHNHVGFSFVSVGVEGEADVRHYEPLPGSPAPSVHDEPFSLREVQRTLLTRGRSSSLTRTRANIHEFRAGPEGARFFDFGVNYGAPNGGFESFSKLVIDENPLDARRRISRARWIGNPKR